MPHDDRQLSLIAPLTTPCRRCGAGAGFYCYSVPLPDGTIRRTVCFDRIKVADDDR